MALITLPTLAVAGATRRLATAAVAVGSPFTGSVHVQDWGGRWWEYDLTLAAAQGATGRALSAFLAQLQGPVNTFLFADPSIRNNDTTSTPLVNGAAQSGNSLDTDGWTGAGLRAGDFFSLGTGASTRLYQMTADAVPSGGAATLEFIPALRSSPADNDPVQIATPQVVLRTLDIVPVSLDLADVFRFSFSAREAI